MRTTHHIVWAAASVATVLSVASMLTAGPLTPPAGAVAPTGIPLGGIEPRTAVNAANTPGDASSVFVISQPGSYYLTGNITGEAGKSGIVIQAGGVTLDLMGFELVGVPGSSNGVDVVAASGVRIVNGSLRDWGDNGIIIGAESVIERCVARSNGASGITVGANSVIEGCVAQSNGFAGITTGENSTIVDSTVSFNGFLGLFASAGSVVRGCSAQNNSAGGIVTGAGSTVSGCAARANGGDGIATSVGSTISGCAARENGSDGIAVGLNSTVSGCAATANDRHGVLVSAGGVARENACRDNGAGAGVTEGAGVFLSGPGARAENNTVTSNDVGVSSVGEGFIAGNNAAGNATAYVFQASDASGTVVDLTAGGPIPAAAGPWSNFVH